MKENGNRLKACVDVFTEWLYLPDCIPLLAVLGAVAANRSNGVSVWLVVVGPPASGKSQILRSLYELKDVVPVSTLTEASLMSGTSRKEIAEDATGGVLKVIGHQGIIVAKDWTSFLKMPKESRATVMAALREIYDGQWDRALGNDGGQMKSWQGKVGFLTGSTGVLDRNSSERASLGERFLSVRVTSSSRILQARKAVENASKPDQMNRELTDAVIGLFSQPLSEASIPADETDQFIGLADVVTKARSAVDRDRQRKEITLIHEAEHPARVAQTLQRLYVGLLAIGVNKQSCRDVLYRVALDSIPIHKGLLIRTLHHADSERGCSLKELHNKIWICSEVTLARKLDDLLVQYVVQTEKHGNWRLMPEIQDALMPFSSKSGWGMEDEGLSSKSGGV